MHPTREEIKAWLKEFSRSRAWLGQQCGGIHKRTVDNWLSATNQDIPAASLALIARLIAEDRAGAGAGASIPQAFPRAMAQAPGQAKVQIFSVEVDLTTFRTYNRAALSKGLTIEDWIIRTCDDEVARMEMDAGPRTSGIIPIRAAAAPLTDHAATAADSAHWLDLLGGIAAGAPIAADLTPQPIRVPRAYPDGHYALKVCGRSMEPKIPDGATIIVAPFQGKGFPKKGSLVIYNDGHGATLKELAYRKAKPGEEGNSFDQVPILKSLNPAFKDVQTMEGGRIDGVMVEVV
ncbi:S24 family peptidase [Haloferula sp. BvORR071]|uniref:S24 family peptidase n=1 Tax=Haloferula sp. BvORR071 TaxID=1396141 RepID=UPI00069899BF|nr:S24 family peptidase [Haloferula sp. BvORR071]